MSFFNPEIPLKQKEISSHPWDKTIGSLYSGTYKYGHNSAKNPVFPPKKEKKLKDKRIKITVIGNRVTKDFIYCYYLAKGLHKYRPAEFEAPVIRGVSGVEWPQVLRDLRREYGGLSYIVTSDAAVLINDKVIGGRQELKDYVQCRYIYHLALDYDKEGIRQFANYINSSGRPCAYLHISIDGACVGSLIFMLYSDIVPHTCENFLNLCHVKKGGYTGTPVHRIVKDCWIQCGGFGLKSTSNLECENFQVPHDRRGVLCMANDGRHNDCSTQFFVLLQPAPWMANKYVAFGQLIEGEGTLRKIEEVATWYQSPNAEVVIYKAGVFNMDCHRIPINKNTNAYLQGHTENLIVIGEMFYEELLQNVFMTVQLAYLKQLAALGTASEAAEEESKSETYLKTKAELQKQLELIRSDHAGTIASGATTVNNDFDVDVYEYEVEIEEHAYQHLSVEAAPSVQIKPEKTFYLPFTDVPYPGEVDSIYDLKKVLKGDYCMECDLEPVPEKRTKKERLRSIPEDAIAFLFETYKLSDVESDESLDTDEEKEIEEYLKNNTDITSFAGQVVKKMAHMDHKFDQFNHANDEALKGTLFTDEELRVRRVAEREYVEPRDKKVSICLSATSLTPSVSIKRRQTGYIRPTDLQKIHALIRMSSQDIAVQHSDDDEPADQDDSSSLDSDKDSDLIDDDEADELYRKVRIAPTSLRKTHGHSHRATSFAPRSDMDMLDGRQSVLTRLYDEVDQQDDNGDLPTLKDYKSHVEEKSFLLLSNAKMISNESINAKYYQPDLPQASSIDHVLALQHGSKFRKISSDYVRTIDVLEHTAAHSIRAVEFSKKRPSITIEQYKMKNQEFKDLLRAKCELEQKFDKEMMDSCKKLRLPGDSPIHEISASLVNFKHW